MYCGLYHYCHFRALYIEPCKMEYPHINDVILHHSVKIEE